MREMLPTAAAVGMGERLAPDYSVLIGQTTFWEGWAGQAKSLVGGLQGKSFFQLRPELL